MEKKERRKVKEKENEYFSTHSKSASPSRSRVAK
ncbi:MAG: hypothetical protein PWQ63_1754 [Methanolobus sp.]|jgi:hypothetical protein|nr:hypothetical protein [Methanolobus sp.]MDK2948594.1 hypothetical protein [Methanolobus sp.]